jgi:lactosylceramide 4-alpha-galactosyltransferase
MRNVSIINHTETEPTPGDKHIIFVETGCFLDKSHNSNYKGLALHKRQVCAIESAAKMNPNYKVYLLYSCPVHGRLEDSSEYVQTIFTYPNVHLWRLETKTHFSNTPLETWNFKAAIMNSLWAKEHASDVVRFLTLWKYGGTYLDMDFVILR